MFDIAIIAFIGLAAFLGFKKGFVAPAFAVALSLLSLYALYAGPGAGVVPSGAIGLGLGVAVVGLVASLVGSIGGMLVGLLHRVSLFRAADRVLGVPLGALTGLVAVYLALVAVVSFDNLLAPFHGKPTVDQAAVAALKVALDANPQFAVMIDPKMLESMATQVAKSAIPADQLERFDQTIGYYETQVRPQLIASALAPMILSIGERAPILGRHVAFPAK